MTATTVYLYPGLKEEVDEKRYIHRRITGLAGGRENLTVP
jgi:hypothetical protein